MRFIAFRLRILVPLLLLAPLAAAGQPLAHTYSIVARDPATGNLGVAVQSHWFQVGAAVPWARAGVGAVATQSFVNLEYGERGLDLMAQGMTPQQALDKILAGDPQKEARQVGMVDARGRTAAWTGSKCIEAAGHLTGEGYAVQANLMEKPTVWGAMAKAYEASKGDFAERLLTALEAAQAEGGDVRGRQSAAILIVAARPSGKPGGDRLVDLRVDDNPAPLKELRRLLVVHRAYEEMDAGDAAMVEERIDDAVAHYSRAVELYPGNVELPFWQAVTLFAAGREDEALPIFRRVLSHGGRWSELIKRLPAAGLLPDDPAKLQKILAQAPGAPAEPEEGAAEQHNDKDAMQTVRIRGTLSDEGVECQALQGSDGRLYTLVGELGDFPNGTQVEVTGTVAEMSFCQQGTTIAVTSIRRHGG